jgi:uncharacterized protein (TIGR03066 family)
MRIYGLAFLTVAAVCLSARAEDKPAIDKAKLVGAWEAIGGTKSGPPAGLTVKFSADGKIAVLPPGGKGEPKEGATYIVAGNVITVTPPKEAAGAPPEKFTVLSLTDDKLVLRKGDDKDSAEFKRKK